MEKITDLLSLFRKGNEVANPEAWHDGGNAATLLAPVLLLLVKVAGDFGYGIKLDPPTAATIALGVVACVHFVIGNIASKSGGLLPAKAGNAATASDSVGSGGMSAEIDLPGGIAATDYPQAGVQAVDQAAVQTDPEPQGGNAYFG
jgi:hypothetical protein